MKRVPTALWTLHRACALEYRSQISYPFPGLSADLFAESVNLIPFFHIFLFSIPLTRYARYEPGGKKDTLFTRFYWRGWCTGPNETCPPPPPGLCLCKWLFLPGPPPPPDKSGDPFFFFFACWQLFSAGKLGLFSDEDFIFRGGGGLVSSKC